MTKILSIANQKGGVAKTTTAVNLAAYLAAFGKRVLLIDLDPQGNATSGAGVDRDKIEQSVYHVLIGAQPITAAVQPSSITNLDVVPADLSLVGAEVELVNTERREFALARAVEQFLSTNQYDFVIIDTPPSLGLLTLNALAASTSVLIPMQCEYYALEGLAQLYKTISLVRQNLNRDLQIEGLVFSMVDQRANLTQQVIAEVKKFLKDKVYETVIPRNIRLAEAPSHGKPILSYDKASKGAEAYEKLCREFLARNQTATTPAAEVTPTDTATPNPTTTEISPEVNS
jgi:chromosome partitioning protein